MGQPDGAWGISMKTERVDVKMEQCPINGSNDVTKFLLAEIKEFRVKIENGVVVAY